MRIGRIVVGEVSETLIRSAFPDCEVVAAGADFQITVQLKDLADVSVSRSCPGGWGKSHQPFHYRARLAHQQDPEVGCLTRCPGALDRVGVDNHGSEPPYAACGD